MALPPPPRVSPCPLRSAVHLFPSQLKLRACEVYSDMVSGARDDMTEAEEGRGVRPGRRVALHERNGAPRLCDGLYAHPHMRAGSRVIPRSKARWR
jgi:hypothetical protein